MNREANAKGWGFYGREAELSILHRELHLYKPLKNRWFRTIGIAGRRGVGKNTLLEETVRRAGQSDNLLVVQLPAGGAAHECVAAIEEAVENSPCPEWLNDFVPPRIPPYRTLDMYTPEELKGRDFRAMLEHLLYKGVLLCLDEFHHIRNTSLVSDMQRLIDGFYSRDGQTISMHGRRGQPVPKGQLVLMGSHQQHFHAMQEDDQPLYGRFYNNLLLRPWSVSTVMAMAAEHGWLKHPGRFLTLWTAYDGLPHNWERFATSEAAALLRDASRWPSAGESAKEEADWQRAFLDMERNHLAQARDARWNTRTFIELPGPIQQIIIWMGRHPRRAYTLKQLLTETGVDVHAMPPYLDREDPGLRYGVPTPPETTIARMLGDMEWNVGMVHLRQRLVKEPVWMIHDNTTMFQIGVMGDMFAARTPISDIPQGDLPPSRLNALHDLEGIMLERLTAGWLESHSSTHLCETNVVPQENRQGDIDVLARIGKGDANDILLLANVKRQARKLANATTQKKFQNMGRQLHNADRNEVRKLAELRRVHLLVATEHEFGDTASPDWIRTNDDAPPEPALCMDIATMHREVQEGWPRMQALLDAAG